jgi:hypothetical protein
VSDQNKFSSLLRSLFQKDSEETESFPSFSLAEEFLALKEITKALNISFSHSLADYSSSIEDQSVPWSCTDLFNKISLLDIEKIDLHLSPVQSGKLVFEMKDQTKKNFPFEISPLSRTSSKKSFIQCDAILVDDDSLIRQVWSIHFKKNHKDLLMFRSWEEFEEALPDLPRNRPLYLDRYVNEDDMGELKAFQYFCKGFTSIYLVTGSPGPEFDLQTLFWIKAVRGKSPPQNFDTQGD